MRSLAEPRCRARVVLIIGLSVLCTPCLSSAQRSSSAEEGAAARDISGFWELSYDSRSIPAAKLQPWITSEVIASQIDKDLNARRWCHFIGVPQAMDSPRPIDIRQGRHEVLINFEWRATPRHIYLDRTEHPAVGDYDLTSTGDSIGRWEGDTFVVETVQIDGTKGQTLLPGGGFRTSESRLTERYRLLKGGSVLEVTFTWEDPQVYRVPHTYAYRYMRAPRFYEVQRPLECDPLDQERAEFFTRPLDVPVSTPTVQ